MQSLTEALAEHGYQLMLGQAGDAGNREDALLHAIIGCHPDGIVLTGILHSDQGRRRLLASGVMTKAQARGIAVPGRLANIGFGDLEFAADLHPALTTVHINGAAIGRQAARFIVDRAEGRSIDARVSDIGFSIIDRQST